MIRRGSPAAPKRSRVAILVVVLLATLGLVGALAFEAYRAGKSHRQVSEQVLLDYVGFAARELSRHAGRDLSARTDELLGALACGVPERSASDALARLGVGGCGTCAGFVPAIYARFDPDSGRIVDSAGEVDAAALAALEEALAAIPEGRWSGLVAAERSGRPALYAWQDFGRSAEVSVPVHAILIPDAALAGIIDAVLDERPLLPNALVETADQRAHLTAELRLTDGTSLHRTGAGIRSAFTAVEPLEMAGAGEISVVASLASGAADQLIIGGLPGSRLPLLAGLLLIGAGLVTVAVHQLRREHELARLRDAFVSGVSHELRTPLAQIRMFAETLRHKRVRSDEESERSLAILDEEAERLSHLVDNILAFNRAGRVSTTVSPEPLELAPLVTSTLERFQPLVRASRNRFVADVPGDLVVHADRDAMAQVLINLLDNAVKYGREGQTVRITATRAAGRTRLVIDDEGAGVSQNDRRRIWQPFVRGPNGNRAATGTGIGLSVVHELVVAMGGRTWTDDAPGGGARFVIELRTVAGPDAAALESSHAPA